MGRRIAKVVNGAVTYYLYDKQFRVIEERTTEITMVARYTYGGGIDELLLLERDGNTYYIHRDALGSITEVTDDSGSLVERYEYNVYGQPAFFDGSYNSLTESAIGNPYLFTGRRYDPESGNYYHRARIYSPVLGRFLSMDPLGYAWSILGWLSTFAWFAAFLSAIDLPGRYSLVVVGATFGILAKAIPFITAGGFGAHD